MEEMSTRELCTALREETQKLRELMAHTDTLLRQLRETVWQRQARAHLRACLRVPARAVDGSLAARDRMRADTLSRQEREAVYGMVWVGTAAPGGAG